MKRSFTLICLISALSVSTMLFSQSKVDQSEITSTVPELNEFHEIIFPMWHKAYPAKDYNALKELVPRIKTSMEAINKAKLPGILRDKESEWRKQLNEMNNSAQNYYTAAGNNDNDALLKAAERLHSGYESMNRVIRPSLKEIDDFHQTLYIIYHKLYPESKFNEIIALNESLITKAQAIMNYPHDKLKARLGDNTDKFDASAKQLYNSTVSLKEVLKGTDTTRKKEAIESVHKAYMELDSVFK